MVTDYEKRLRLTINKNTITLYTFSGLEICTGYERIVIGFRGPYIEFTREQLFIGNFIIPEEEKWRITSENPYYIEYRTKDVSNVKMYFQKKTVDYADYKIGYYYISPFDLRMNIIDKIKK